MTGWQRLDRLLAEGTRVGLVTILAVEGSSPREAGARMLVMADGRFTGTIGGGALEWQVLAQAQRLLASHPEGKGSVHTFALGPGLGQCCGGNVKLLIEALAPMDRDWITPLAEAEALGRFTTRARADARGIFVRTLANPDRALSDAPALKQGVLRETHGDEPTPLLLFGAGHVGRALVLALAPLPFLLRWIDPRPDAFPAHVPGNVTPVIHADPAAEIGTARPGTLALVMTHSHALDLDLMAAALANPVIVFAGVIGSRTKRARFASRLGAMGLGDETIARMVCPIGLPTLTGKAPAIIAAGVAVQVLEVRETMQHLGRSITASPALPLSRPA